uniref:Phosphoinositide 5-phosphatase n=1 Tax=Rhabditophanes sp. KR3021 TaxID=114890 RepID=A0AC35U978_9BILA
MSLRGFRLYSKTSHVYPYSLLIESPHSLGSLLVTANGIITLSVEETIESKKEHSKIEDAYGIMGVIRLSRSEPFMIIISGAINVGQIYSSDLFKITNVKFLSLIGVENMILANDSRLQDLQRLISSGIFYFSNCAEKGRKLWDLTMSCQKRSHPDVVDHRFFWNRNLFFPFERYGIDTSKWLVKCTVGFVESRIIYVGHKTAKVAIVSRLSCERVGTRFNVRGVNDEGHVANFVETEQIITYEDYETSYLQIRGSVPLFWEQPGINVGSHKVKLRILQSSLSAFEKHFDSMDKIYGPVTIVNLLGSKEGERILSNAYKVSLKNSSHREKAYFHFDYHAQTKNGRELALESFNNQIRDHLSGENIFLARDSQILKEQNLTLRTNCLDCLDRTNSIQTLIGSKMIRAQINSLPIEESKRAATVTRIEEIIKDLWQRNGNHCSIIYAGTGALEGKSKIRDASRSIARTIQNNLMDSSKQDSFDLFLLGCTFGDYSFDRASNLLPPAFIRECPHAVETLVDHQHELAEDEPLSVFVGTWNVNGGKNMNNIAFKHDNSLDDWIFPNNIKEYDVIAIGLEEIVDLNASNIVKVSYTNQHKWSDGFRKCFEEKADTVYALIACEQLVGVCIFIYVKTTILHKITEIGVSNIKTGMGGTTGNKGSVAVRLTVNSSSFCFVCSHFAAGQNNVKERNEDFAVTFRNLKFAHGRYIKDHDFIFWFGDFNYRISMPGDDVKHLVRQERLEQLVPNDQLTQQRLNEIVFAGFDEGPLTFPPTYKYDTFSDDYDTSEKARSPAWTDRILVKNNCGRLVRSLAYERAELKTSDHRPVMARFIVHTAKRTMAKCENVLQEVLKGTGPPDGTVICTMANYGVDFPPELKPVVLQKIRELGLPLLLTKIEGPNLWLVLADGIMALAACSMDGIQVASGGKMNVKLRSPNWNTQICSQVMASLNNSSYNEKKVDYGDQSSLANFDVDADDEEIVGLMKNNVCLTSRPAPPIPVSPYQNTPRPAPAVIPTRPAPPAPLNLPKVPPRPGPMNWP